MPSLVVKVKSKLAIHAHTKVRGLLEGEYGSVFKGRSMDFDDLREYIPGDDVKDIDWKATARSGQTLIKRYIAVRKHNILLVVDTGKNMTATATSGESKRDVAVMAAGILGYLAQKHGDLVAMVAGDDQSTSYIPLKGTNEHLEHILQHIDKKTSADSSASNLAKQLEYVSRSIRRRMMLVIVADDLALSSEHERLIRRLDAQHEIMWLTIGDMNPTESQFIQDTLYEVESNMRVPDFIRRNKQLTKEFSEATINRRLETKQLLDRLRVTSERISGEADIVPSIFKLLERQKRARR